MMVPLECKCGPTHPEHMELCHTLFTTSKQNNANLIVRFIYCPPDRGLAVSPRMFGSIITSRAHYLATDNEMDNFLKAFCKLR